MTDSPKRRRLSRGALRALAWVAGGLAFLSPFAGLTLSPKPATADPGSIGRERQRVIVRRITKRVIVRPTPAAQPVQYVYVGGGSPASSNGGGGSAVAAAPAPAPATSTGGS